MDNVGKKRQEIRKKVNESLFPGKDRKIAGGTTTQTKNNIY